MVNVFGNNIIQAYTGGFPVKAIYAFGEKVWPNWYIKWTPTSLTEQFSINGVTYDMSDYNGYFTSFSESITGGAFISTGIVTMETNATIIEERAFASCPSLISVSASQCSYIGNNAFWSCNNITSMYIPECTYVGDYGLGRLNVVQTISLPKCSYIGQYGFFVDYSLQSMDLPECTTIRHAAFGYCSSLKSVSLPKCDIIGSTAFYNCTSLKTVYLPECNTIGSRAFNFCTSLQSLTLGVYDFCTLYNSNVFDNTNTTFKVYVPMTYYNSYVTDANWTYWSSHIVSYRYASWSPRTILNGFSIISDNVFHSDIVNRKSITEFYTNVSTIDTYALSGCTSLINASIPNAVTIGSSAFANCSSLQSAILPVCTSVYQNAFQNTNISVLSARRLNYIDSRAFEGCANLTDVYIPRCLYIGSSVFKNCDVYEIGGTSPFVFNTLAPYCSRIEKDAFYSCSSLKLGLFRCESIGTSAFKNNGDLELFLYSRSTCDAKNGAFKSVGLTIYVPPELYEDYKYAGGFEEVAENGHLRSFTYMYSTDFNIVVTGTEMSDTIANSSLTRFYLNARGIRGKVCYNCSNLSTVHLYLCEDISSVALGGSSTYAFENCPSLKTVYIYTPQVCKLYTSNTFSDATSIYVPWFLVSDYKTAQYWSRYSNKIFAIPS